jgi:hypothetical protein
MHVPSLLLALILGLQLLTWLLARISAGSARAQPTCYLFSVYSELELELYILIKLFR